MNHFASGLLLACFWLTVAPAGATPPASCANKFVGSWTVRVEATGQTYPSLILPNGRTQVTCPMCTPGGSWTCSGDMITVNVDNGVTTQHRLHADGRTMSGGCCTITRSGPAPVISSDSKSNQGSKQPSPGAPSASPGPAASKSATRQAQSCSDITGLGGGSTGPSNCKPSNGPKNVQAKIDQAKSYLQAAKTVKESDPSYTGWVAAAAQFRKAAAAFQAAGDQAQASSAVEQAQTLENALKIADQKAGQASQLPVAPAGDQPSNLCPASAPASYWQGTQNEGYCANANCVERGSAAYGIMCYPPDPDFASKYKPQPDPQQLGLLAREKCGSYSRETAKCFGDFKLEKILNARPDIKQYCEKQAAEGARAEHLRAELAAKIGSTKVRDDPFVECVDDVYLHGFERVSIRERLRDALKRQRAMSAENTEEVQKRPDDIRPHDRCAPGQGMKPTPGAFGARSCQPLGIIYLAGDKNAFSSGSDDGAASLAAFENRVSAVAAAAIAAAAAAEGIGNEMSEADRQACLAVAYEQARDVLKGGLTQVPANCKAIANAALSELSYYAGSHADDSNPAIEDLLASFNRGASLGGSAPGMEGLTPLKQ